MENNNLSTSFISNAINSNRESHINESSNIIETTNIKKNINNSFTNDSSSLFAGVPTTILESETIIKNETNKTSNNVIIDTKFTETISSTYINNIINNTSVMINNSSKNSINKNIIKNNSIDTTTLNLVSDYIKENDIINQTIFDNQLNNTNNISNVSNSTNSIKKIHDKIINSLKNMDKKYVIAIEILFPLVLLVLILFLIVCCIKKRKSTKLLTEKVGGSDKNGINFQSSANNTPYNKLQNTSGFNVGINPNNYSMSEIKVQNLKDEIHNIITNNSGGSNSSGKRKREKRKMGNNNNLNISSKENNKGIQNEIKEEIKQYVIDEHLNNS